MIVHQPKNVAKVLIEFIIGTSIADTVSVDDVFFEVFFVGEEFGDKLFAG